MPSSSRPTPRSRRGPRLCLLALALALGVVVAKVPHAAADDECQPEHQPDFQKGARLLGEAEKSGSIDTARDASALFERCEKRCPDTPWYPMFTGVARVFAKDLDGATNASRRLRELLRLRARELNRPESNVDGDPKVLFLGATISLYLGNTPGAAVSNLERARARDPGFERESVTILKFRAHLAWAKQLADVRDWGNAIKQTQAAISEATRDVEPTRRDQAKRNLAQLYRGADLWKESQILWEELLTRYPADLAIRYGLAGTFADQFQYGPAIEQWRAVLKLMDDPKADPYELAQVDDSRMRYAICLVYDNRVEEGKKELLAYIAKHPEDGRGAFNMAKLAWEQFSQPVEARKWAEKARALDPWCEQTIRLLITVLSNGFADDAEAAKRAKELKDLLDNEGAKAERSAEMDRRRRTRTDGRDGCI